MKSYFLLFALLIVVNQGLCQLVPMHNDDSLLIKNNVKSCSSYYQEKDNNHLIQKLDYDENGKLTTEYLLYLWDVISYSYTNTYQYNDEGKPVEILRIQKILNLYPKDADYIESFGDAPVNEKIFLSYDKDGHLIKKEMYVFHTDQLVDADSANRTITYEYQDRKLMLEKSSSPETRVFNYNYTIKYHYDNAGNLIRKIRTLGTEKPLKQETRLKYDSAGQIIEKYVIDSAAPHNNVQERYEYNTYGQISGLYEYSKEEEDYLLETTYEYDSHGQKVSGDRDVNFEYLENGLIKSESWKDTKTNQQITFTTEYQYF